MFTQSLKERTNSGESEKKAERQKDKVARHFLHETSGEKVNGQKVKQNNPRFTITHRRTEKKSPKTSEKFDL